MANGNYTAEEAVNGNDGQFKQYVVSALTGLGAKIDAAPCRDHEQRMRFIESLPRASPDAIAEIRESIATQETATVKSIGDLKIEIQKKVNGQTLIVAVIGMFSSIGAALIVAHQVSP